MILSERREEIRYMLVELRMKLESDNPAFGYYQSSNMQGVLMERINTVYAEQLHKQGIKPYSQFLLNGEEKEWIVKTCTQESYQEVILPLLDAKFDSFKIDKKNFNIKIKDKYLRSANKKDLLDEFYSEACSRYLSLEFLTPTSFRSNGKYMIIPNERHIYQSLMNKYSAVSENMEMYDDETLEQLVENSSIIQYKLKSTYFPIEGVKIPSFKGEISMKIDGTDTMARYARLLARFGEYSGVGIKTAMGMGALRMKGRGDT